MAALSKCPGPGRAASRAGRVGRWRVCGCVAGASVVPADSCGAGGGVPGCGAAAGAREVWALSPVAGRGEITDLGPVGH